MRACVLLLNRVLLVCDPIDLALQVPLCMRQDFSRQEYWSGFPFSPPGDLPNPEIEPTSPALAGGFFTTEPPGKPRTLIDICKMNPCF